MSPIDITNAGYSIIDAIRTSRGGFMPKLKQSPNDKMDNSFRAAIASGMEIAMVGSKTLASKNTRFFCAFHARVLNKMVAFHR